MARLLESAKKAVIEEIQGEQSNAQLSQAKRAMIDRVRAIEFESVPLKYLMSTCQLGPVAWYLPRNKIALCPTTAHMSEPYIVSILAHEIGHAFDSCMASHALYQVDKAKLHAMEGDPALNGAENFKTLREIVGLDREVSHRQIDDFPKEILNGLKRDGVLQVRSEGIAPKAYPLQRVVRCLNENLKFKDALDFYLANNPNLPEKQKQELLNRRDPKLVSNETLLAHHCEPSQISETLPDVLAARVLAKHLKKNPPRTNQEKAEALGAVGVAKCLSQHQEVRGGMHPAAGDRLEKILFANKEMQKIFGCQSDRTDCGEVMKEELSAGSGTGAQNPREAPQ